MEKVRILIVEDQALVARHIKGELERLGYEVAGTLEKGEDVLNFTLENQPDLILMDIYLAGKMNGIDAAIEIKKHINIPIIYLTDSRELDTFHKAKLTGPENYLTKPFNAVSLGRHIELALYKYAKNKKATTKDVPEYANGEIPNLNYFVNNTLYVRNEFAYYKVNLQNLLYIKGEGEECLLKTKVKDIPLNRRLKGFINLENRPDFAAAAKHYIVNLSWVTSFDENKMIMHDKIEIPMSDDALEKLKILFRIV